MRITQQMMTRNYLKRMNNNLGQLTKSNERLSSQRKFNKSFENVPDAAKALKVRKMVADNERYLNTIRDAEGRASIAEDSLRNANSLLIRVQDRLVEGLNGTMSPDDRKKIGAEIGKLQDEVFQIMNTKFSDRFIFGGAGGATQAAPFSKSEDGKLLYHGTDVDSMVADPVTGKPSQIIVNEEGKSVFAEIPFNKENYVDIGAGYQVVNGKVDPNTGFKDTYSGVQSFGFGTNESGVPQNLYSLLGRMVDNLNNDNMKGLSEALSAVDGTMNAMLTSVTEIGTRSTTLDDASSRLEAELVSLYEKQNDLEGIDLSKEIMHNKQFEMSWMVTLQLGSKILPSTIFDFLR